MKKVFLVLFFFSLHTLTALAMLSEEDFNKLKSSKKDLSYQDLAHKYSGCPENSGCNARAASDLKKWHELIKKISNKKNPHVELAKYAKKNGILAPMLGSEDATELFNGIIWTSPCEIHNKRKNKIRLVDTFVKKATKEHISLHSNGKDITWPVDKNLWADPIYILDAKGELQSYFAPRGLKPLYFSNKSLFFLMDSDSDIFFKLKIDSSGTWSIANNNDIPKEAFEVDKNITCPKTLESTDFIAPVDQAYRGSFCDQIWDEQHKKAITLKRYWTCR